MSYFIFGKHFIKNLKICMFKEGSNLYHNLFNKNMLKKSLR